MPAEVGPKTRSRMDRKISTRRDGVNRGVTVPGSRFQSRTVAVLLAASLVLGLLGLSGRVCAQTLPKITLGVEGGQNPKDFVVTLQIVFMLAILSLAPALLIMVTSFTRIIVVFSFLRQAIGTQQMPPNQVIVGLALFLTFFIMTPVWNQVNSKALQPYIKQEIDQATAVKTGMEPIREFMLRQTREKDLMLFMNLARMPQPRTVADLPNRVLIPSFVISELRTAFQISIVLFIPFIIIDMVVASTLLSMGMMMLPPAMISIPFKLLLFVMVDGWHLIARSLVLSFR